MREAIELHDSDLLGIRREGAALLVDLNAYLHRSEGDPGVDAGTGWIQRAEIRLEDASAAPLPDAKHVTIQANGDSGQSDWRSDLRGGLPRQ